MSYELIYNLSSSNVEFYTFLIPLFFGLFLSSLLLFLDRKSKKNRGIGIGRFRAMITFILGASFFLSAIFSYGRYVVYQKYVDGDFSIVEGKIERFTPKTKPREMETIVVDGIQLSYSKGLGSSGGFNGGQELYDKIEIGKNARIYSVDRFIVRFELEK